MEFSIHNWQSQSTRVVIDPVTVLFVVDSERKAKKGEKSEAVYPTADLLQQIISLAPSPEAILTVAVYGNAVVSIHRHAPEDGGFEVEMVEIRVGPPTGSGACLCLPMTVFTAILSGEPLPVSKKTAMR